MLLRSSSTPILNSWLPNHHHHHYTPSSRESSPDNINNNNSNNNNNNNSNELSLHHHALPRSKSNITTILATANCSFSSPCHSPTHQPKLATRTLSDTDLRPQTTSTRLQRLFSSSGLDEAAFEVASEEEVRNKTELATLADGSGYGSGDGSGGCCGGGFAGGGGGGGGSGFDHEYGNISDNHGSVEVYYQKMIEANPGDPLLLGNYARFLKEVSGDLAKAEEYCGRAILNNYPAGDANLLALYADIIWETHRDAHRAQTYFDQAVHTAPHDSYVLASYAKFLWDVEDEEEEEEDEKLGSPSTSSPPKYLEGMPAPNNSTVTAA